MKNTVYFIVALMLTLSTVQVSAAQNKGGSASQTGGSSEIGTGDQIQDRDQDRIQDPTTHDGDELIQDRDQDRLRDQDFDQDRDRDQDRIQDPTTHDGDEPIQDRDQDRESRFENALKIKEYPDMQAQDDSQLRNMMFIRHQELIDESEDFSQSVRTILQNQNQFRETAYAFLSVGPLMNGPNGEQVRQLAEQMQERMKEMVEVEYELKNQSRLRRVFFGGNDENGMLLLQNCEQVREQVREMNQYVDECDQCGDQIRETLREQIRLAENECGRLEEIADNEVNSRGVFGFLFGWLR